MAKATCTSLTRTAVALRIPARSSHDDSPILLARRSTADLRSRSFATRPASTARAVPMARNSRPTSTFGSNARDWDVNCCQA